MPRRASRSLGCAVAARRLLPLSPLLRRFRFAHASRSRRPLRSFVAARRARARSCGGAGARWSAADAGIKGAPSSPRFQRVGGFGFLVVRESRASATRQEPPSPCTVTGCVSGRSSLRQWGQSSIFCIDEKIYSKSRTDTYFHAICASILLLAALS